MLKYAFDVWEKKCDILNANSDNPRVGHMFQELSKVLLSEYYNKTFNVDIAIPIGEPAKEHKFDCVSEDKQYVAECKCYTWTETGNTPSAKMAAINEAVFLYALSLCWDSQNNPFEKSYAW